MRSFWAKYLAWYNIKMQQKHRSQNGLKSLKFRYSDKATKFWKDLPFFYVIQVLIFLPELSWAGWPRVVSKHEMTNLSATEIDICNFVMRFESCSLSTLALFNNFFHHSDSKMASICPCKGCTFFVSRYSFHFQSMPISSWMVL